MEVLLKQRKISKLKLLLIYAFLKKEEKKSRKCWVNSLLQKRIAKGHFDNLIAEMRLKESIKFFNYHRMTIDLFDELLEKVSPKIEKLHVAREPISAGLRLSLTLRYLASGDLQRSLSYNYRVSEASACKIIAETCKAIWDVLFPLAFKPLTINNWKEIEKGFNEKWNFPNCIGAIDGKHCTVQAFANSGSSCFNYKGAHSLVLMAVCDADYNFVVVDIGASGRFSDSGIFKNTSFGKALVTQNAILNLPEDKSLPGSNIIVPHVFVGDEAFPLLPALMRPFPGRNTENLETSVSIFNYRLSRARRMIENTFGVLAARWRIFRKPIHSKRENVVNIVKATVCLHNWIKKKSFFYCAPGFTDTEICDGEIIPGRWRQEISDGNDGFHAIGRMGANNSTENAAEIRKKFKNYFNHINVLPWQNNSTYA